MKMNIDTEKDMLRLDKGFTLIEIMIAMVVLMIGMLGVMSMQYYSVSGNASSRELRVATNLSHQLIEQMKSTPYVNLSTSTDRQVAAADNSLLGGITNFTQAWWVVPDCFNINLTADNGTCTALAAICNGDPDGTMAVQSSAIRVRTCWTDRDGTNHAVSLDTVRWNENVTP